MSERSESAGDPSVPAARVEAAGCAPIPVYRHHLVVGADDIDFWGHVNNLAYLRWCMAAATEHSAANGWSAEAYRAFGAFWVVRTHHLDYRRAALVEERVVVRTWVSSMSRATSRREYRIELEAGGEALATGYSEFAMVDLASRRPRRVPEEISRSFILLPESPGWGSEPDSRRRGGRPLTDDSA